MKEYKKEKVDIEFKRICDICGFSARDDKSTEEELEFYEFFSVNFTAGYMSVFGDGNEVKLDICQYCLKEKLGKYMRIEKEDLPF